MPEADLKPPAAVPDERVFDHLTLKQKAFVMHYLDTGGNATRTHFFAHEGQVISEREVIDFKTRATYLDIAYRLLGSYKESATMPPGGWPSPVIYLPEKRPSP